MALTNPISKGDTSMPADTTTSYDFSSTRGGSSVTICNKSGGTARVTFNGDNPTTTFSTIDEGSMIVTINGGTLTVNAVDVGMTRITEVIIRPFTDDWVMTGVTLWIDE